MKIDQEIQALIPPHTPETYAELEADIILRGCMDPLIIWAEEDILLDGHTRHAICTAHGIPYTVRAESYASRDDAMMRVYTIQCVRRNMSIVDRLALAARMRPLFSSAAKKRQQYHTPGSGTPAERETRTMIARAAGCSPRTADKWMTLVDAGVADDVADSIRDGHTSIDAEYRRHIQSVGREEKLKKVADIAKQSVAPLDLEHKYPVIYMDPPWQYDGSTIGLRGVEYQYPTMTEEELVALPVGAIATDDAVIYMWTTSTHLPQALRLLNHWGFSYRTMAVWDKVQMGMGFYFRGQVEYLLVATRGTLPAPTPDVRRRDLYSEQRGEHSVKPTYYYEMIEEYYPVLPKIELFARSTRPGWASWGNQV
jgi:N6-adenosine-specific RNA methylase IME4